MTRALVIPERDIDRVLAFLEEGAFDAAQSLVKAMIRLCPIVDRAVAVAAPELLESCEKLLEWINNLEHDIGKDPLINALPNNYGRRLASDAIAKAKGG